MLNLAQVLRGLRAQRSRAQKEVERLSKAIAALGTLNGNGRHPGANGGKRRRRLSSAARRRISQAQKARWAKLRMQKAKA